MTSYFQDGGHGVISRKAASPLHVTSLARCTRYSIWSTVFVSTAYERGHKIFLGQRSTGLSVWLTALTHRVLSNCRRRQCESDLGVVISDWPIDVRQSR